MNKRSDKLTNSATASNVNQNSRGRSRTRRRRPRSVSRSLQPENGRLRGNARELNLRSNNARIASELLRGTGSYDRTTYLNRYSPYFKSITDPFRHTGAKIPDPTCYPSSTFTVTFRYTVSATQSTNGTAPGVDHFAGFALDSLSPERTLWVAASMDDATKAIKWVPLPGTIKGEVPQIDEILKLYRLVRPVSAGLCIMRDMASLNDQGVITSVCVPTETPQVALGPNPPLSRYTLSEDPQFNNFSNLQQAFTAVQSPVRDGGSLCIYRPADETCHQYTTINYGSTTSGTSNVALPYYGGMIVIANGLAPGVPVTFVVRINYEAVPYINSFSLVSPSPSPRDSAELDEVINHVQTVPAIKSGENSVLPAQETATTGVVHGNAKPAPKQSFLARLFKGLSTGVRAVAPVIEALI